MPVKIRLSLMLCDCKSRIVSFMILFSAVTEENWVVTDESWVDMVVTVWWTDLFSCVSASIWCWLYFRLLRNCWNSLYLNESDSVCPVRWVCCLWMWTCQIPRCSMVVSVTWVVKRSPMKRVSLVCVVFWLSESVPWWRVYCSICRCRLQGDPGQYFKSGSCSRRKEQEFKQKGWKIEKFVLSCLAAGCHVGSRPVSRWLRSQRRHSPLANPPCSLRWTLLWLRPPVFFSSLKEFCISFKFTFRRAQTKPVPGCIM